MYNKEFNMQVFRFINTFGLLVTHIQVVINFRYIAICFPIIYRNLSHSYTATKRVVASTLPVMLLSVFINLPKFFETKVITDVRSQKRLASVI